MFLQKLGICVVLLIKVFHQEKVFSVEGGCFLHLKPSARGKMGGLG